MEVEKKERAYSKGVGGGVHFPTILKSKMRVHTAANAHLYMPAGPIFHSLVHWAPRFHTAALTSTP